ncbi:MAG: UDP-N-acetylmuramoyl-L-alanine--D-glutamate ligase [Proteobacteria bacterium]|nr:UDP-N-acetylmuramoyl-L-alanine--D-glutamate ligase [Burkholderiales bacterium]
MATGHRVSSQRHAGERVAVVGLGATGVSCVRFLARHGARVCAYDTRPDAPGAREVSMHLPELPMHLGPMAADALAQVDWVAISPGVPRSEPAVARAIARGVPVIGDIEIFARHRRALMPAARTIAVTGTNGKSTVTEMAGQMVRAAGLDTIVAGNIGLPVLEALSEVETAGGFNAAPPQAIVLELSSFQLESTSSLGADVATMLNLSEDHLDRYAGLAEYAQAKARVFEGDGVQVLNRADPHSMTMRIAGRECCTFGIDAPDHDRNWGLRGHVDDSDGLWLAQGDARLMPASHLPVAGSHNVGNALAALALARALALPYAPLLDALRAFRGLAHRMQHIAQIDGVEFYDDSKGTNVGATVAALRGFSRPIVLIAGGDGKGQDFSPLAPVVAQAARAVVLIGLDAGKIARAIAGTGVITERASTLEEAVARARALAHPGDAVVLSPACASFDMFRNYVHRAQVFVAAVEALVGASGRGAAESPSAHPPGHPEVSGSAPGAGA